MKRISVRKCEMSSDVSKIKSVYRSRVFSEAFARRCSVKKVFLEISQNSQETPVPESFFNGVVINYSVIIR